MAAPWDCPTCGQQHPKGCHGHVDECTNPDCLWRGGNRPDRPCSKCGGTVAQRPCKRAPAKGGTLCAGGGKNNRTGHGSSPQVVAAAEKRQALDLIAGEVAQVLDEVRRTALDPTERLLLALEEADAMRSAYQRLVGALDLTPKVRIEIDHGARGAEHTTWHNDNRALWGTDHQGDARPHVLVTELHRWTETTAKLAKAAIDANISERRIQLDEGEIDKFQQAVMAGLAELDLTPEQQERFTAAFVGRIRELEA